jgi:hypothetical protein
MRDFPIYTSTVFTLKAYPFALLQPFAASATLPFPDGHKKGPRSHLVGNMVSYRFERKVKQIRSLPPVAMGLVSVVGKKSVHPSAVIRSKIKIRMKEALRLVVTRGASAASDGQILLNCKDTGEDRWLMKGG